MTRPLVALVALALAPWADSTPAASGSWVDGVGFAYPEDPSRSPFVQVTLRDLWGDGTRLDGRYVRVRSGRIEPDRPFSSSGDAASFLFEPTPEGPDLCAFDLSQCSPFDAVNVYFHVDRVAREFWRDRMGFDPPFQADAVVHLSGGGAVADPVTGRLLFRLGDPYTKNAAREDDIVYHEYAHLVTWAIGFRPDTSATMVARAVNEGTADYFAATFTDDPGIGEYLKSCTPRFHCIGPEDDVDMRTLETDASVWNWRFGQPEDNLKYGVCTRFGEVDRKCKIVWANNSPTYVWGMIWGGALWDVRETIGAQVTDRLVFESIGRLDAANANLEKAAGAVLWADERLFEGRYRDRLEEVFVARGIRPGYVSTVPNEAAGIAVPGSDSRPPFPNPATGVAVMHATGVTGASLVDASGRTTNVPIALGPDLIEVDLSGLRPGVYWLRAWGLGGQETRSIVVVR